MTDTEKLVDDLYAIVLKFRKRDYNRSPEDHLVVMGYEEVIDELVKVLRENGK